LWLRTKKIIAIGVIVLFVGIGFQSSFANIIENHPPFAPEVWWTPKHPKTGETINLTFNAVDPDGDDVRFIIDWGDGSSDTTTYVPSGINKTVSFTAGSNGTYYYYITAEDDNGAKSDVTTVKIVVGNPPDIDFVNPKKRYFHIYGVPSFKNIFNIFADTANIGGFRLRPIQVKCNFEDPNNHTFKVQLKINGKDMGFGTWNPKTDCFEWYWTGLAIGEYDLMLRYIDEHGGVYWAYMSVWNLCFLP
jgi:hypothetical protein